MTRFDQIHFKWCLLEYDQLQVLCSMSFGVNFTNNIRTSSSYMLLWFSLSLVLCADINSCLLIEISWDSDRLIVSCSALLCWFVANERVLPSLQSIKRRQRKLVYLENGWSVIQDSKLTTKCMTVNWSYVSGLWARSELSLWCFTGRLSRNQYPQAVQEYFCFNTNIYK